MAKDTPLVKGAQLALLWVLHICYRRVFLVFQNHQYSGELFLEA
jgi:hypothetical protein